VLPGHVQGANMAFRRDVLQAIGGFDPLLGAGTPFPCEDLDAASRASQAGWKGGYFPAPTVHHHHRRRTADVAPLLRSYRYGLGAYFASLLLRRVPPRRVLGAWYWMVHDDALPMKLRTLAGAAHYVFVRVMRS
jgi:GT2 family glycosyltransferase